MAHLFKNAALEDVLSTDTDLYTCPAATQSSVHTLILSNKTGTETVKGTVKFYDSSQDIQVIILKDAQIEEGNTLLFDKPINLEVGDKIQVISEDGIGKLSAFASVLEVV
jgi:hypothetical protein